jgi:hypothetical protein
MVSVTPTILYTIAALTIISGLAATVCPTYMRNPGAEIMLNVHYHFEFHDACPWASPLMN